MRAISRSTRNDDKKRESRNRGRTRSGAGSRYEVLERAGEGTLFVVYKVRNREDNQILALKAAKSTFTKNASFATALADAAETTLGLSHPHIAEPVEVGEEEGTVFVVTEWLPANNLEERLRRAPFGRVETLTFVRQIAEALHYLHSNGVMHGDLRPHQVLFNNDGKLKLTDAGLWPAFPAAGLVLTDVQQDAAYYLSPEYEGSAAPTPASDLYALGVILYRMLTGRVPFDGASALSIATRHRRDNPMRPSQWNPSVPADLEAATLRLLEKDPASRYASAADLLNDLNGKAGGVANSGAVENAPAPQIVIPAYNEPVPTVAAATAAAAAASAASANAAAATGAAGTAAAGTAAGAATGAAAARPTIPPPPARQAPKPPPQVQPKTQGSDSGDRIVHHPVAEEVIDHKLGRKKQRKREAIGALLAVFWLLVAIGLLCGIVYGGYRMWQDQTPPAVTVPDYREKSRDTAAQLLARRGLKLVVASEVYDPKRPADTVIKGDPPAGKQVRAGREVLVTISKGQEPIKMPDLTELDLQRARQIIERSGMKLGQVADQYHDTVPKGYIISQYPEAGQPFRRSESISLTVSRGPTPVPTDATENGLPPLPADDPSNFDDEDGGTATPPIDPSIPQSDVPLISRTITVRVAIPADGQPQDVSIDVQDQNGERTVYQQTHNPGDLVRERVRVTRQQGTKARIRIYVDGSLLREQVL